MAVRYFRIVFLDRDNKKFGVSSVTSDDTPMINATCKLQEQGRNVNIATCTKLEKNYKDVQSLESVVRDIHANSFNGYTYDPDLRW